MEAGIDTVDAVQKIVTWMGIWKKSLRFIDTKELSTDQTWSETMSDRVASTQSMQSK
jgi:hypothetical protein